MPREVFEPFAHAEADRRETEQFRSSWLASSLRSLRTHDLLDAYRGHLPERYHRDVFESIAGQWLPVEVAKAHYAAIDELHLSPFTAFEMGREVQQHAQNAISHVALRASRVAGVTPWTVLRLMRRLWTRTWDGGDFAIYMDGPKEAALEIVAWSIAPSPYVHHAMRGVVQSGVERFCEKVYVKEMPATAPLGLTYRLAWV